MKKHRHPRTKQKSKVERRMFSWEYCHPANISACELKDKSLLMQYV